MRKSKSSLFLMELIIVIFFFALTSAVCLQVFVKAHDIAYRTESMNYATLWADNAGECFYEYGNDQAKIMELLNGSFNLTDYTFTCDFSEDEKFTYMSFSFYSVKSSDPVYSYTFKKHNMEVLR